MIRNQSPPQNIQVTPADSDAVHGARSSLQVLTFVVVDLAESSSVLELSLIHISEPTRQVLVSRMPSSA
mgnify:CR=1 FL=1